MEYLINLLIFEVFYSVVYVGPIGLLLLIHLYFLSSMLPATISKIIYTSFPFILILSIIFSGYRANLAAKYKVTHNVKFAQAHAASWAILKTNLSFIPIVGKIFQHEKNDQ